MIKAKHHWFYSRFFNWYVPRILKSDFHTIEIDGKWSDVGKPALIIGNHISWWDGFWALYLNNLFLKKKFHAMMLEEQLRTRKFLSKTGAFSIDPGKRSMFETLEYTVQLLESPNNAVTVYPQGRIASMTSPLFEFGSAADRILKKSPHVTVCFYAAFVDYFSERKPSLFFYLEQVDPKNVEAKGLAELYRDFYYRSVKNQATKAL